MDRGCHYCGTTNDLRPYGPGGAWVCFPCGTATPERDAQVKAAFDALIGAASVIGGGVATIGTAEGPMPGLPSLSDIPKPSPAVQPVRTPSVPDDPDACASCPEGMPVNECPNSERPCGHHCNCSWDQDHCHWCDVEFGEDGEEYRNV